jgi:hypothetical protein
MTSFRQIEVNRRNAIRSTGPNTFSPRPVFALLGWVVFGLDVAADGPPFSYVSGLTFDPGANVNRRNRS